ncbi:MAG: AbrB/MazE/SpoVT family DNA-binding domain-containing protein, partial [Solirubrobacteraceae bacterium]
MRPFRSFQVVRNDYICSRGERSIQRVIAEQSWLAEVTWQAGIHRRLGRGRGRDSILTQKGQVTIPLEVRRTLGIEPRSEVEFELDEQGARLLVDGQRASEEIARM